ncbi:MAG: hypothetical protein KGJ59_11840, partial [Bacteroidota bacterium]|nr:hypothetical protein [Bacteroidota bacterium]
MVPLALTGPTPDVLEMIALALAFMGALWLISVFVGWLRLSPWKRKKIMHKTIEELQTLLELAPSQLAAVSESESSVKP